MSDMTPRPCEPCNYFNHAKGVWETHPNHWVHFDGLWVGVGFADATAVARGVQHYVFLFKTVVVGGYHEDDEPEYTEVDFGGCEAIGTGGIHSDHYGDPDDGMCQWCGLVAP
jgi:hypothetical protein